MARLQDFQTVTPTSSDNILIVQSTGQGLASVGSTLGAKMDKANPTGTGTLTMTGSGAFSGDLTINGGNKVTQYHDFAAQSSGTTVTYTVPSSLYTNGAIFILALKNQYGGGVYIVRCHGGNNKVSITPIVESPYATVSEVAGHADQFSIASTSYIEPRVTRIA